jgi:tetratricopeptide (TPR) repeat protein
MGRPARLLPCQKARALVSKRRIFLSATNRGLKSFRLLASQSLRKRGYDVDDEAIFDLTWMEITEMLERRISDCDAVVCLIGVAYGGEPSERPPDQPRRSYSQLEYFLAQTLNKPVFRMLADVNTPFDADSLEPEGAELRQIQDAYRAGVIRDRDWRAFASVDQLRAELAELRFPWEGPRPDHKPSNLPLASIGTLFKGREAFLDDLRKMLGPSGERATIRANVVAVHGLGGVGKTRAAVEYAVRRGDEYTALLFVSAPTPADLHANLANLCSVMGMKVEGLPVDKQMAEALDWLDAHPGWLMIVDNVDTVEAVREVERLLVRLRAGHVLITSRVAHWSAGVQRLDLDVLAPDASVEFLLERTPLRRKAADDALRAAEVARKLDGLALALEQAGAYVDTLGYSFTEYLQHWEAKRADVLGWHDFDLMKYPASVAVTWETTFAGLTEPGKRLLEVLAWLAPEPIPLALVDAVPLAEAIPDPRGALAGLMRFSLARFEASGDAVFVHRLVQEIARRRIPEADRTAALQITLKAVNAIAPYEATDVRTWSIWTPLAPHADAVSQLADAEGLAEPTAFLMNQLGLYRQTRGQFAAAEPLFRRALSLGEATFGRGHTTVATYLNNLAEVLRATNRLAEAEPLYRRAFAIDESSHGPVHADVARDLNNLAGLLRATNRLAEAEPLYRRALAIDESSHGPDHADVARDLNNLALLMQDTNRLAEAEPLYRRALAINEASFGPDHPTVATALNNLAGLLDATNRLSEAEPLYCRALSIDEASFGPDHPAVARDLNNLAALLRATNRLAEAGPPYRRALAIGEASFGRDHPAVAAALSNLAELLRATNRLAEAEPLSRRALAISEASFGRDHPTVAIRLNILAGLLQDTNGLAEAEPLYRRALAIDEESFGRDHPTVAIRLNNLAVLLRATNRLAEAEPLYCRAFQILVEFRRRTGHEHRNFRSTLASYRGLLQALGKTPDQIEQQVSDLKRRPHPEGLESSSR